MKKLTRKTLDELAKILPVVSIEEQAECWGGGTESCVFNCFDYLDGNRYSSMDYYWATITYLGYTPQDNGGVPTSDIAKIGLFGGFSVKEITSSEFILREDGTLQDGSQVMMTFNKDGIDHAVVVTGFEKDRDGKIKSIKYFDPTTGKNRKTSICSGMYSVRRDDSIPSWTSGSTGEASQSVSD